MRCKNCGWENSQSTLNCEKCNAPLNGSMGHESHSSYSNQSERVNLKQTVSEKSAFGSTHGTVGADSADSTCRNCGYPIARNMNVCPMCGSSANGTNGAVSEKKESPLTPELKKCPKCKAPIQTSSKFCPSCGAPIRPGTINPWMTPQAGAFCTLKPISWQNEGIEFNPLSFSGDNIVLNRSNTDPNNQSITSKEQAELVHEGGVWYIIDKSEQQTTYVHAGRKTKLESGDIIILGNRRFEFKG